MCTTDNSGSQQGQSLGQFLIGLARDLTAYVGQCVPELGFVLLGAGQSAEVEGAVGRQLAKDVASHLARQFLEHAGAEVVVIENCVRGGKRAGPRVAAQQPARGQAVQRLFQPEALAAAFARLSFGEEQCCAQLVALLT